MLMQKVFLQIKNAIDEGRCFRWYKINMDPTKPIRDNPSQTDLEAIKISFLEVEIQLIH